MQVRVYSSSAFSISTLIAALVLSGCASVDNFMQGDKVDYKSATAQTTQGLDIPPDLTQLQRDGRFALTASGTATASTYGQSKTAPVQGLTGAVLPAVEGMRIEKLGDQRYLVVNRKPEDLWQTVKEFWVGAGFSIAREQPEAGVMETDWAENRAKIPQDVIRRSIGRVLDGLYDTGLRDKFRVRLERTEAGSEVFVSHRGMEEVFVNQQSRDSTVWKPRATDPSLEVEFLRRLMVRLGEKEEASKLAAAKVAAPAAATTAVAQPGAGAAKLSTINGKEAVEIAEPFERAWRRVGVALDRSGFTVEDRDRAKGQYFVRYVEGDGTDDRGFFSRIFGGDAKIDPTKYEVTVKSVGNTSQVTVAPAATNTTAKADSTGKILAMLAEQLK
jgi:outer membrane protein assembly factor BamC